MEPVAGILTRSNGRRVYGELAVEWAAPHVGRVMFRAHGVAYGLDELQRGLVVVYSDPREPPTKAVKELLAIAEQQSVFITRSRFV